MSQTQEESPSDASVSGYDPVTQASAETVSTILSNLDKEREERRLTRKSRTSLKLRAAITSLVGKGYEKEEDVIQLNPLQKMVKYRKYPWKMLLDIALAVIVVLMIYFITRFSSPFLIQSGYSFTKDFMPEGYEEAKDNTDGQHTYYFQKVDDVLKWVNSLVSEYDRFISENVDTFDIPDSYLVNGIGVDHYAVFYEKNLRDYLAYGNYSNIANFRDKIQPLVVISNPFKKQTAYERLTIHNPLGKYFSLEQEAQADFFDSLDHSTFIIHLRSFDLTEVVSNRPECKDWEISFYLDAASRTGTFPLRMDIHSADCINYKYDPYQSKFSRIYFWFAIVLVVLSPISLFLVAKSIIHRLIIFVKKRKANPSAIPMSSFFRYVSMWHFISLAKDICNILGCFLLLIPRFTAFNSEDVDTVMRYFVGFGALFTCTNLMRYFQLVPRFYILILAMRVGLPVIVRFMISISPIAIGMAVAGTLWFGHYSKYFESFSDTFVTMFCLMFADEIRKVSDMLYAYNFFFKYLSRVYIAVHSLLFIYAVLSISLLIMEESYFSLWNGTKTAAELAETISKIEGFSGFGETVENAKKHDPATVQQSMHAVDGDDEEVLEQMMEADIKQIIDEHEGEEDETHDEEYKRQEAYVGLLTDAVMEKVRRLKFQTIKKHQLGYINNIDELARQLLKQEAISRLKVGTMTQ